MKNLMVNIFSDNGYYNKFSCFLSSDSVKNQLTKEKATDFFSRKRIKNKRLPTWIHRCISMLD